MSLILDALNRAEQERSEKNHIPSLQSVHGSTEVPRPSLLQRLHLERWLIVLVVAYLAYDYFSDRSTLPNVDPAPASVAVPDAVPGPAPELAQMPQSENRAVPPPPTTTSAPTPAQAPTPAPTPAPAQAPPPLPTAAAAQSQSTTVVDNKLASPVASSREVESLYKAPSQDAASSPVASKTNPLPDNTAAPASRTSATEREQAYARSEAITQLALGFRQQIPTLKYASHMPSADPAESRVVLNGSTYKEGDEVVPGVVLKAISEAGIVLEFQGTQFRLEAHNSWINFQ